MSAEKDEYIESPVSLEGKYPRFVLTGEEEADILVLFEAEGQHRIVNATSATEDIGGDLELHISKNDNKLAALRFPGAAKRWKLERFVRLKVSIRFEDDRDMIYIRLRWFLRQELSLEIEELDEDLVLDLDKKDRVIGFAISNAKTHFRSSMLDDMKSDGQWIKLVSYSEDYTSLEAIKAAKKAKKKQKKEMATNATRAIATPSPSIHPATSFLDPRVVGPGDTLRPSTPAKTKSKKKKTYTGTKVNLIPTEGRVATHNTDESNRTYFTNRFVRDLEWALNFPFILRPVASNANGHQAPDHNSAANGIYGQYLRGEAPLPLIDRPWIDFGKSTWEFLADLDRHPEEFLDWIRTRLPRGNNLGGYFTLLIEFLLSKSLRTKTLVSKYQMYSEDKRTMGDFDFLIQFKGTPEKPDYEPWVHWEAGIKFYLFVGDPSMGWKEYVGPHCTGDTLEKYVIKITRQLDLAQVDVVADLLRSEEKHIDQNGIFLKGYVFYPLTQRYYEQEQEHSSTYLLSANAFEPYPSNHWVEPTGSLFNAVDVRRAGINDGPVSGWWAKYHHQFPYNEDGDAADPSEENLELVRSDHSLDEDILLLHEPPMTLAKQEKLQHSMWTILSKMDYMAPLLVTPERPDVQLLTYAGLMKTVKLCFATNYRSLFVAEVIPYSRSQYKDCPNPLRASHVEASRGFIVGNHWPGAPPEVNLSE